MKLNEPKEITFLISLLIIILAIVSAFVDISVITENGLWVAVAGWALLAAGNLFAGI